MFRPELILKLNLQINDNSKFNSNKLNFSFQFDQVRKRFENSAPQYQLPPCKEVKAKVVECYKSNASQTLNCAPIVADFENCVQSHRTNLLNEKYATPNKQPIAAAS